MKRILFAALGACVALAACENAATAPNKALGMTEAARDLGQEENIVTFGDGSTLLPTGFGLADFSFHANAHADGSATGTFRMFRLRNGLTSDFEGEVTCVTVDPVNHRAWIGGVVTVNNSTDPNQQLAIHQPGMDVWFRVVDNGKDSGIPDRTTVLGFVGIVPSSAAYCAQQAWAAGDVNTFPLAAGDLKVKE
jgi:hypothetical protein